MTPELSSRSRTQVVPEAAPRDVDTRVHLLDVAEELFAQHGYVATSTRMIARASNINLGNVHYYFKSKEALYEEVFQRRGRPLVAQRLQLLADATTASGDQPVPVRELIRCFVLPLLLSAKAPGGAAFAQLHCRLSSEPMELALAVRSRVYDSSTREFVHAFRKSLVHLPEDVLYWRIHFMIGAYLYTLVRSGRLEFISGGRCRSEDVDEALSQILPFLEAGFLSPAG